MFSQYYNKSIRKMVLAFGSLFNDIIIQRENSNETIRVPLSYGPKEKFIRRIEESSSIDDETKVQITLPYMGFEITGYNYDSTRKRNTLHKRFKFSEDNPGAVQQTYAEIPYDIEFSLYVFSRNMEDGLQIIEQIMPFFTPQFNVTLNFNEIARGVDVPIILNSVANEEDYQGDYETRRSLIWTLTFTAKTYIYGPIKDADIIRQVQVKIFNLESLLYGGSSGPVGSYDLISGQDGISGSTGAFVRIDAGVSGASTDGSTYDTVVDIYVRGNELAAGLSAGGGCGPNEVGPWFIDVFGVTGDYYS